MKLSQLIFFLSLSSPLAHSQGPHGFNAKNDSEIFNEMFDISELFGDFPEDEYLEELLEPWKREGKWGWERVEQGPLSPRSSISKTTHQL